MSKYWNKSCNLSDGKRNNDKRSTLSSMECNLSIRHGMDSWQSRQTPSTLLLINHNSVNGRAPCFQDYCIVYLGQRLEFIPQEEALSGALTINSPYNLPHAELLLQFRFRCANTKEHMAVDQTLGYMLWSKTVVERVNAAGLILKRYVCMPIFALASDLTRFSLLLAPRHVCSVLGGR